MAWAKAWALFATMMALPALAGANTVAITEFINNTTGAEGTGEWVELYNYGATTVTMTGWRLRDDDNDNLPIPPDTEIGPKQFLVMARNKAVFEAQWLDGRPDPRVIDYVTTTALAMSDSGPDEIKLVDSNSLSATVIWRLAYGSVSNEGKSTVYVDSDNFATRNHGEKNSVIVLSGPDNKTGMIGYETSSITTDPHSYLGKNDIGSPLRGDYPGAQNPPPPPTSFSVDLSLPGTYLNPGVRGIALADQALDRHDNSDKSGILPSLERATGSSIRGVSGGLNADIYDWRSRNGNPRPTTLEFMRYARDSSSTLFITANSRGLTEPDPNSPGERRYYTSDTATLARVAADWVRYTNRIAQQYRLGDPITDPTDAAILEQLTWSSSYVNEFGTADNFTTLPLPGEAPVPPVRYWEIGNEPTISLARAYTTTNAYVFTTTPTLYRDRYIGMTEAMLAEDPTIKVGPCLVNARAGSNATMLATLLQSDAQVDFISYHPYGSMIDWPDDPLIQQQYLATVHREQTVFLDEIKALVAQYRPGQVNTMEYVASETNVSDWRSNNTFQEGTMAHALGSVESVMSWGRLGLSAAHYWIWITAAVPTMRDGNRYPVSMAFEMMRDKLGDRLLGSFDSNDRVRIHVTRSSATGQVQVWAMNFSNAGDVAVQLHLQNGPAAPAAQVKSRVLQNITGPTSLFSVNLPPEQNGNTMRRDVDWSAETTLPGADPANLQLVLPAATLTLLTVEPAEASGIGDWPAR